MFGTWCRRRINRTVFLDYDFVSTILDILEEIETSNKQSMVFMTMKSQEGIMK